MSIATILQTLAADLTAAYNKISAKGGTVPQNKNADNLANAIDSISTGITPTGTISITQNGTHDVTNYASAAVNVHDDTEVVSLLDGSISGTFENRNVTSLRYYALQWCTQITKIVIPNVTRSAVPATQYMSNLKEAEIGVLGTQQFMGCPKMEIVKSSASSIGITAFQNCRVFNTLVLTSPTLCSLANVDAFNGTKFQDANVGGTVYVPYALVSTYEAATNWSALESVTFAAIEESLVALQSAGIDISDYFTVVQSLPTENIAEDKVYLIETQTAGTYEQWFHGSGSWVQPANITLGASA